MMAVSSAIKANIMRGITEMNCSQYEDSFYKNLESFQYLEDSDYLFIKQSYGNDYEEKRLGVYTSYLVVNMFPGKTINDNIDIKTDIDNVIVASIQIPDNEFDWSYNATIGLYIIEKNIDLGPGNYWFNKYLHFAYNENYAKYNSNICKISMLPSLTTRGVTIRIWSKAPFTKSDRLSVMEIPIQIFDVIE